MLVSMSGSGAADGPVVVKDGVQVVVDRGAVEEEDHLTVELMAHFAAVEAADGGPGFAADAGEKQLGVDTAGSGVAKLRLEVKPIAWAATART